MIYNYLKNIKIAIKDWLLRLKKKKKKKKRKGKKVN
jgi:hypothetical protein